MKRTVQLLFLFFAFLMFLPIMASAQEEKTSTITITITEDGKVTTDTTFELSEGQDPDAVKKIVEELAGGDINIKMEKHGHKKVMYITEGEEGDSWNIHDIDIDSIKEAHGGAHVMVMKSDDGTVNVKVLDEEDEDYEFESEEGKTYKVKVIKEGKGDCEGEKHINVFIGEDDEGGELEWVEEDEDGGEVIIIKSDDGTEKVIMKKQIKVEIHEEGGEKQEQGEHKVVKKKVKKEEE